MQRFRIREGFGRIRTATHSKQDTALSASNSWSLNSFRMHVICACFSAMFFLILSSHPDSTTQQRRRTSCREFYIRFFQNDSTENCPLTLSSYMSSPGYQNIICFIVFQWHFPGHEIGPLGFFFLQNPHLGFTRPQVLWFSSIHGRAWKYWSWVPGLDCQD